jgi:4-amino-4-deoxy-L-arabinose transferase-like glycosyltransferase
VSAARVRRDLLGPLALLGLLAAVGLFRPLLPIDETRYASVAWEMWVRGDFLVPFRNGEAYHHKPPLLFWLMHAGWALFGVNEWWPRLISPLFAAGTLWLSARLARRLWPQRPQVARMAPYILLSIPLYSYFATALMFDAMLAFFVTLGLYGLARAWQAPGSAAGFGWLSIGLAGALYAKGPVALVHLMPAALLAPWWVREPRPRWRAWYVGVLLALLGAAALILAWAVPAGLAGGEDYRNAIFWGQTAGRMAKSFSHRAPAWFYLAYLPLMLAPWLLWPRWWRGLDRGMLGESGTRLLLLCVLSALLAFSLISGKRWHYLLSQLVPFALLVARALCDGRASGDNRDSRAGRSSLLLPALGLAMLGIATLVLAPRIVAGLGGGDGLWALYGAGALTIALAAALLFRRPRDALPDVRAMATATILSAAALLAAADGLLRQPYDVQAAAAQIAVFQAEGRRVAVNADYHGQWHLAGRLKRPLEELATADVPGWLQQHPDGQVVVLLRRGAAPPEGPRVVFEQPRFRGGRLLIVAAP